MGNKPKLELMRKPKDIVRPRLEQIDSGHFSDPPNDPDLSKFDRRNPEKFQNEMEWTSRELVSNALHHLMEDYDLSPEERELCDLLIADGDEGSPRFWPTFAHNITSIRCICPDMKTEEDYRAVSNPHPNWPGLPSEKDLDIDLAPHYGPGVAKGGCRCFIQWCEDDTQRHERLKKTGQVPADFRHYEHQTCRVALPAVVSMSKSS